MAVVPRNEAETRAELIDRVLADCGWDATHVRREQSLGKIELSAGLNQAKRGNPRTDYTLRLPTGNGQAVAIAVIEAKDETKSPLAGLQQGREYARRLAVPFTFSTNGHLFVEHDEFTGATTPSRQLAQFPSPDELRVRYEAGVGFSLTDAAAKPLTTPYKKGENGRRAYQDAAIRAALVKVAQGQNRVLLQLATGAGKTYIAANLLRKIADAGQLKRALFLCDRDELRTQATAAMRDLFGSDAAAVATGEPQTNARVLVATYQTLGIDGEGAASFLTRHYPDDFFSHIVVDECHRSAFGSWRAVLDRNKSALQIGLTATPRALENLANIPEDDKKRMRDTVVYFGEPVYSYSMADAFEDGYLAVPVIERMRIFIERKADGEEVTGIGAAELEGKTILDKRTGDQLVLNELQESYSASSLENTLHIPERVTRMCADLFGRIVRDYATPEIKTVVFCASDEHATGVMAEMNGLYARWCAENGKKRQEPYAVQITASTGARALPDLRGAQTHTFVATTVDLLSTGVDLPSLRNVVFFRYLKSAISVSQMVGRGTRLHPATKKMFFRIYDYTDATRLLGEAFEHMKSGLTAPADVRKLKEATFFGRESEGQAIPIGLANLMLHGIDRPHLWHGNTLTRQADFDGLYEGAPDRFDVLLTNPPFGGKEPPESQNRFAYRTSASQILFMQEIMDSLDVHGRCAMVIDEGVLFRTNELAFVQTKKRLLAEFDLWGIVSLPGGVFTCAGAGVKTNILFFDRTGGSTKCVWYYDLSDLKVGKKNPLTQERMGDLFELAKTRADSDRSWSVEASELAANGYDLKAVNPHRRVEVDTRTSAEILSEITARHSEIGEALSRLNALLHSD